MSKIIKNEKFKYVIIAVVLLLPFIYSFFYLKAYWDPYGEGNIDNLPVAIVNNDNGDKGKALIKSIKEKKKLKLTVVSDSVATDGLNDGKYYAVITIPKDFTSSMESAATTNKRHATITYSPNQKSNYLSSQIINTVVNTVEKNLDNQVNSKIVSSLTDTVEEVPNKLETISSGFSELKEGTTKLSDGSKTLTNGTNTLEENYNKFNDGVLSVSNGAQSLASGIEKVDTGIATINEASTNFNSLSSGLNDLSSGITQLKTGSDTFTTGFNSYVDGVNNTLTYSETLANYITNYVCPTITDPASQQDLYKLCLIANGLTAQNTTYGTSTINYLKNSGLALKTGNTTINTGITKLNNGVASLNEVPNKINQLQAGLNTLKAGSGELLTGANNLSAGANTLYSSSLQIKNGISTLNSGSKTLNNGLLTLDNSVGNAKDKLDSNISTTRKKVKKVEKLSDYSKEPIKVKRKEINKVSSYGTAFSPLFIAIGLWVGCLMMFVVFYYDKQDRFKILGMKNKNRVQRTLAYHGLITISSIVLGILLNILLDFNVTNIFLYYLSIVLIGNTFMAIIDLLIMNFNDIGKFIGLIILVLQLAAAGGTFPIETVTKGFRWMHNFLPMTYAIRLLRETLITLEKNLFTKNLVIMTCILIIFMTFNLINDYLKQRKEV